MNRFFLIFLPLLLSGCVGDEQTYPTISFGADVSTSEPNSGTIDLQIPLDLDLNGESGSFSYSVQVEHLSTSPSDAWLVQSMPVTVDAENPVVLLRIAHDSLVEGEEKLALRLSSSDLSVSRSALYVTITDTTEATSVGFSSASATISEGSGDQSISVVVTNPSERDDIYLTISYAGTATKGTASSGDYYAPLSELTIPAGLTSAQIPIEVIDDGLAEGGESIVIAIDSSTVDISADAVSIFVPGDLSINDTGVVSHWDGASFVSTPSTIFAGQDAGYGRDVGATDADGHAGFRLTKIDYAGNATSSSHRCVVDENTGLMWEVKSGASSLPSGAADMSFIDFVEEEVRLSNLESDDPDYKAYSYHTAHAAWDSLSYGHYWYVEDGSVNGGFEGVPGPEFMDGYPMQVTCAFPNLTQVGYSDSVTSCSTASYALYANGVAKCGVKDWRLPTIEELRSIMNFEPGEASLLSSYFPSMDGAVYMSSTPYANERGSYWCFDTANKISKLCNKHYPGSLMLVRGE